MCLNRAVESTIYFHVYHLQYKNHLNIFAKGFMEQGLHLM